MLGIMDAESEPAHEIPKPLSIVPSGFSYHLSNILQLCYTLLFGLRLLELGYKLLLDFIQGEGCSAWRTVHELHVPLQSSPTESGMNFYQLVCIRSPLGPPDGFTEDQCCSAPPPFPKT